MVKTFLVLAATAALLVPASATRVAHAVGSRSAAAKQPVTVGFYRGSSVRYYDFGPIKLTRGNKVAPIWTFTNGAAGQRNIIDTVPGRRSYTPLWRVSKVTWVAGKTRRVLRSAAAVRKAARSGQIRIVRTTTVVNCPVLGFGQKVVTGFSGGHVIHYYDLGPVKVAPGNAVVPLYTVTNGVGGQHNVTGDTVARGQTAYPPLWSIFKVTWRSGAKRHLLTSYAAIRRAVAARQATVLKTSLVVNCPLV